MTEPIESYDSENDSEQEFEDGQESISLPADMTLTRSLEEAQRALKDYFNNHFVEAKSLMEPCANISCYHALGSAIFLFLEAIMTFEQDSITLAIRALKRSLAVSNKFRKKNTFGQSVGNAVKETLFDQYTDIEAHAELCHAESLLLRSALFFVEDETLSSINKAGFRMRSSFGFFQNCQEILLKKTWEEESNKIHFESGVRVGLGSFNLMLSLMPARVMKLLELEGLSVSRNWGLREISASAQAGGLRRILSVMVSLFYQLITSHVIGYMEGDLRICRALIQRQLSFHPESMWFLFFQGQLDFFSGNLDAAQEFYIKSWKSQNILPQFHHLCFWELFWVHCLKTEWRKALFYCDKLMESSKWSRCLYSYLKAVVMLMIKDELTPAEIVEVDRLMVDVSNHKQRIAGKLLPMEKFAVNKAKRYLSHNCSLPIPIIEIMLLWNFFKIFKKPQVANGILKIIENSLKTVNSDSKNNPSKYDNDNKAIVLLAQGTCLRYMGSTLQGLECLEKVISMKNVLVEDDYVVPYAIFELALNDWINGKLDLAIAALEDVKNNYNGYALESWLQFRVHKALADI